jgi:hypothetical protein
VRVDVKVRLSSEILPVVSKYTIAFFMILFWVWTPHSLVVETVKVRILFELVNQINRNLFITMSKRTVLAIFALVSHFSLTELGSVFVWVIEFFDSCVTIYTSIPLSTLFLFGYVTAKFRLVISRWSSPVFGLFVIVGTFL